jgi:hypothetical protein
LYFFFVPIQTIEDFGFGFETSIGNDGGFVVKKIDFGLFFRRKLTGEDGGAAAGRFLGCNTPIFY